MAGFDDIQGYTPTSLVGSNLKNPLESLGQSLGTPGGQSGFSQVLGEAAGNFGHVQKGAQMAIKRVAEGTDGEVHDSMMAIEKANTSFKVGFTCVKKAIDLYKEVTQRMG